MRSCADCGADISDRGVSAYLCKPCVIVRDHVGARARYALEMADPLRAARRREKHRQWAKTHYVPTKPKKTVEACQAAGCKRTWVRRWHVTRRRFCGTCQEFYRRETEYAGARRRRATKNAMRGIAA